MEKMVLELIAMNIFIVSSFFNKSKIGMCLAHALITVLIHAHNSEVRVKGKRMIRPVSASQFQDHSQT
jgi:hypothetical protein